MAWNENGNGQDPWGNRKRANAPNDLDKLIANFQRKLRGAFGGGGSGGDGQGENPSGGLFAIIAIALVFWLFTGFYRVDQAERGLELRFGKFTTMTDPGLHWHFPFPIESVEKVNASVIDRFEQEIQMLTADENFVVINLAVQYRRTNPVDFQFNVRDQIGTISDVSESAIREAVGKHPADFTLLGNRAEVAAQTKALIQSALNTYEAGVEVTAVNLQKVDFPNEVQDAVQDAVKAREDKVQATLSAETYANKVIPEARGEAARMLEAAEAYKQRVINDAAGDASRFSALLTEYQAAPEVTRERLYIDAIEYVYANSTKVFLDAEGGGNLLYLPVDKLLENASKSPRTQSSSTLNRQNDGAAMISNSNDQLADPRARRTR
ncbi:MAG: FtsH protease activity modulator HflK [Pseudomonadota bacterium]